MGISRRTLLVGGGAGAALGVSANARAFAPLLAGEDPRTERLRHAYDVAYGPSARQRLDVYVDPAGPASGRPVVVFLPGGAWVVGDRAYYPSIGPGLAALGAVVVTADYRLYPEVKFPAFVDDGAAVLTWAQSHAAAFGGDASRIHVMGHSSGGHIAALLALDGRHTARNNPGSGIVAGLIGVSVPWEFSAAQAAALAPVFRPATKAEIEPVALIRSGAPRSLVLHGTWDQIVDPVRARRFVARMREAGNAVTLVETAAGHLGLLDSFAPDAGESHSRRAIALFLGLS